MTRGLLFSRSGNSGPFGKLTAEAKTKLDENTHELAERKARDLGYPTLSEWLRDLIMMDVHGIEFVRSIYTARVDRMAGKGPKEGG